MIDNAAQHTIAWFRARHGNITGSNVGLLMKSGRTDIFSETGKSYIYQIASERAMNPAIVNDDSQFAEYLKQGDTMGQRTRGGCSQPVCRNIRSAYCGGRFVQTSYHSTFCQQSRRFLLRREHRHKVLSGNKMSQPGNIHALQERDL